MRRWRDRVRSSSADRRVRVRARVRAERRASDSDAPARSCRPCCRTPVATAASTPQWRRGQSRG
eukprot:6594259-Prymnesium_polylepis.2